VKMLDRYSLWMYSNFTVLTAPDKECLGKKGKKAFIMPNPLTFTPLDSIPPKEKIILASGRINDWKYKGWDVLIKTWGKIAAKYPDWKILIAGNGNEETFSFLKNMAKEHGVLNRIDFLGFRTDIVDLFQRASIFLLSSRTEGLPMVLIEAMSQGCAPVATDFKGRTKEIITSDKEGLLANPEDADKLAENISKLIDDPSLLAEIQKNAIERSKYYLPNNVLDIWESYLKSIVKN
jgi:GalNAc-alpha-(1->4)-GalNAc-alpha-(1->3)-diNAcBac-PP-undecaprenol alpha-1,4-N-acetyl-D-galactosaminyltransferase